PVLVPRVLRHVRREAAQRRSAGLRAVPDALPPRRLEGLAARDERKRKIDKLMDEMNQYNAGGPYTHDEMNRY
ncbi:MAG: hypothetical protein ACK5TA_08365, partial [bacterium]